ncbi:MAG: peptide chain release factor N(5)-glutamine methyltransferase [Nitrospina sp.]|nr:peptide chain release factor N(5)-glutamine methyltransferase [Nitrospina sp.]MBT5631928.1 peptide chain release factor N(5)-glutamine methyltransferase [Nitrospina sp.]
MLLEETKLDLSRDGTVYSFLNWASQKFLRAGITSHRLDAEILIADGLKISRTELMTHPERILNRAEEQMLCSRIERRVLREPVSHITGNQEFWSLDFAVNEKVLTPRPETEILIEQCLKALEKISTPVRILDLGTGSGVLSIVLAKEISQCQITALENSALEIARKNALHHAVTDQICFVSGDFMQIDWQGPYHLIVSNPPYIASENLLTCMPEVRQYEPPQALDGGEDGLDYYRYIVPMAWEQLEKNGWLVLEIGHNQASAVVEIFEDCSRYQDLQVVQDYSGYDRVVLARTMNG